MGKALYALYGLYLPLSGWGNRIWKKKCWKAQVLFWESGDWEKRNSSEKTVMPLGLKSIFKYIIVNSITPVYNFINDRLVDESTDLKPFSQHLFLCVFRCFWWKWQKIPGCEYPDLIQNEFPEDEKKNPHGVYRGDFVIQLWIWCPNCWNCFIVT